jgi:DNA-binding beta-propeller fold protein YncE
VTKINLEIPDGYDVSISDSDEYWQRYYYAGTHFNQPLDVSADKETGDCWISDHNPQFGSRIVRISIDGNIKVSTSGSEGLRNPTSISADFVEGSCWVADSEENYQVVKFSVEGIEEGRTSSQLLDVPVAVSVYPLLEE